MVSSVVAAVEVVTAVAAAVAVAVPGSAGSSTVDVARAVCLKQIRRLLD